MLNVKNNNNGFIFETSASSLAEYEVGVKIVILISKYVFFANSQKRLSKQIILRKGHHQTHPTGHYSKKKRKRRIQLELNQRNIKIRELRVRRRLQRFNNQYITRTRAR